VGHVVGEVEDWRDTCPGCGGGACGALLAAVWWSILEKPPSAMDDRFFDRIWPQNSAVADSAGIGGGLWRHHEGCVEVKQLGAERVAIRSKSQELVYFAPN
jgi:hypothetical protein